MSQSRSFTSLAAGAGVALALWACAGTAQARGDVNWSIGVGVPGVVIGASNGGYYAPPPVYVAPRPIYYAPPPPVYYQAPRPIYYAPPAYYGPPPVYYRDRGPGHRGHHGHHGRGHDRHGHR